MEQNIEVHLTLTRDKPNSSTPTGAWIESGTSSNRMQRGTLRCGQTATRLNAPQDTFSKWRDLEKALGSACGMFRVEFQQSMIL